jgi:hypothetical protein
MHESQDSEIPDITHHRISEQQKSQKREVNKTRGKGEQDTQKEGKSSREIRENSRRRA